MYFFKTISAAPGSLLAWAFAATPIQELFVFKCLLLCFSIFMGLGTLVANAAADSSLPPADSQLSNSPSPIQALLEQANAAYRRRAQDGNVQTAIDLYKKVLQIQPNHYESLWHLAQCYFWLGEQVPQNRMETQVPIFAAGLEVAKRALNTAPNAPEGHFWYGLLLGSVCVTRGAGEKLAAVNTIIHSMEKVISCDPKQGYAYHVLGMLYRMAPGWPFSCGNLDKSLQYARMAVEKCPDVVLVHLGLAETLLAKGKKDEARNELKLSLTLPGPADYQPETAKDKKRAEELLKKI
jgi:tetratricopeptide (TPR) repeat protein